MYLNLNSGNDLGTESLEQNKSSGIQAKNNPLEANTRYGINTDTRKFLSNFRNTKTRSIDTPSGADNSMKDQTNVPIEWTKLCDIVDKLLDLLPSILKDLPSSDRRVKERNEILMVLSEDPRNFYAHIDKYGEHNVKWAITMAERILCPQGRYNDKIASAIAPFQKAISSDIERSNVYPPFKEESKITAKSTIPINHQMPIPKEWKKLCEIVDKLLGIPTRVIEKLPVTDNRVKERNDILMLLSNDPEYFLLRDEKYGARNVDSAILAAKRILCPDGVLDERVRKVMWRQREILTKGFFKSSAERSTSRDRESYRKRFNHKSTTNADEHLPRSLPKDIPKEWNQLCDIVDKVLDTPKEVRIKMSKRDPRWEQRDAILLLLADDPDKLESQAEELGRVNIDWAIKSSKKDLFPNGSKDRTIFKKLSPQRKLLLRNRQSEPINDGKSVQENRATRRETVKQVKDPIENPTVQRNDINDDIRKIADGEQSTSNGTKENPSAENNKIEPSHMNGENPTTKVEKKISQELERNELAILLIKDPLLLKSSEKYLEMVRKTGKEAIVDSIIADVEKCRVKCEYVKEAPVVVCAPIIAKIKDVKFMASFKQKKLIQRIHRLIEQFLVDPKPEVFDVCSSSDGTIEVVCANAMTFDWLKKSINELVGLWNNAELSLSKAPITRKVLDSDDLKEIKMTLKTVPTVPFDEGMKQLKRSNPKLNTDRWQLIPSSFSDLKKTMFVMVDLESLVELERSKREVNVESGTIYFDIQYVGLENF